jgi:SulP family sulfate permease
VEWFLLNAEANIEVDLTAVDALEEVRRMLADRGIVFALARVKYDLREILAPAGFIDRVGEDRISQRCPRR